MPVDQLDLGTRAHRQESHAQTLARRRRDGRAYPADGLDPDRAGPDPIIAQESTDNDQPLSTFELSHFAGLGPKHVQIDNDAGMETNLASVPQWTLRNPMSAFGEGKDRTECDAEDW